MITFSDIYEVMRKERYSEQLQSLPKNFLMDVFQYFKEKKEFLDKETDLFSDMAMKDKKKLENALSSFKELIRMRKKKILSLSFIASEVGKSKKDFDNLLDFEKNLFESVVKNLEKAEKSLELNMSGSSNGQFKYSLVRFLEDISEFLDPKGQEVGPFEKGEIANLENEIVRIFEKDKRVEVLEVD
tara:strand:- start:1080 stop:1637 length:558 start_codon:yes stop_codon:yes gene_type:complete